LRLGWDLKSLPNWDWMLATICSLDPNHPIFQKNYDPWNEEEKERTMNLPESFLEGLAPIKKSGKRPFTLLWKSKV
jgi:hypothetical protein